MKSTAELTIKLIFSMLLVLSVLASFTIPYVLVKVANESLLYFTYVLSIIWIQEVEDLIKNIWNY